MPDLFLDSSLCIDLLHGVAEAQRFADTQRAAGAVLFHVAVVGELLDGVRTSKETRAVDALLAAGKVVPPTEHDLSVSLKLLRRHRPAHGVEWHDCLIAATALRLDLPVATLNDRHFKVFRGLRVVRPY